MSTSTTAGLPDGLKACLWSNVFNDNETQYDKIAGLNKVAFVDAQMVSKTNIPNFRESKGVYTVIRGLPNSVNNAPLFYSGDFGETIDKTTFNLQTGWKPSALNSEYGSRKTRFFCLAAQVLHEPLETSFGSPSVVYLNAVPQTGTITSTVLTLNPHVEARFEALFQRNSEEYFEDGIESDFSREIETLANTNRDSASAILTRLLEADSVKPDVWAEAMRWLGQTHALTRESRLLLLAKGLFSASPTIRDGAIVGLASLQDGGAIPYLKKALDKEPSDDLRTDVRTLIEWLSR